MTTEKGFGSLGDKDSRTLVVRSKVPPSHLLPITINEDRLPPCLHTFKESLIRFATGCDLEQPLIVTKTATQP